MKACLALLALCFSIAHAQPPSAPIADAPAAEPLLAPVTTTHAVRTQHAKVTYRATFSERLLKDAHGRGQATISSTSYVRQPARDRSRPVLFLFNGGPGASSSPLHFNAFGPRRSNGAGAERKLVPNEDSLIDAADLVFVDPVGTGFSTEWPGGSGTDYWSVEGDAGAVLSLIREWLSENGRRQSPVFIAGQSYGAFRLATLLKNAHDLNVAGLIFISPMLNASATAAAPGNDLPFIFSLPTMAIAAWHHGKVERGSRTIEQVYADAARFAQSDYALALLRGSELPPTERDQIAQRMSELIGLPASTIATARLRVDNETFLSALLAEEGLEVGRLDTRITAPTARDVPQDRPAGANDPALGLGRSNVIKSTLYRDYFVDELKVPTARDYISLTLDVNFKWNWRAADTRPAFYTNPTVNVATLMEKLPQARVLLLNGYFDLTTPVLASRYSLTHAALPLERVEMHAFAGGHSPFAGDENRAAVAAIVRSFLQRDGGP